jgi:hypothetical protein
VAEAAAEPAYEELPAYESPSLEDHSCEPQIDEAFESQFDEPQLDESQFDDPELSEPVPFHAWHRNPLVSDEPDESELRVFQRREPLLGDLLAAA